MAKHSFACAAKCFCTSYEVGALDLLAAEWVRIGCQGPAQRTTASPSYGVMLR